MPIQFGTKCPTCKGKGFVDILLQFGIDDLDIDHDLCEDCQGTGVVPEEVL